MNWKGIQENVTVGVISAIVLGGLAIGWNFASGGGLIRLLGGVAEKDLTPQLARLTGQIASAATKDDLQSLRTALPVAQAMERGAVVAFDRDDLTPDRCPEGWSPFLRGRARVIIGAGDPSAAQQLKYNFDENGKRLSSYDLRQHAGTEEVALTVGELPAHKHKNGLKYALLRYLGEDAIDLSTLEIRKTESPAQITDIGYVSSWDSKFNRTQETGGGEAHNNMPPFIALYYCKKN